MQINYPVFVQNFLSYFDVFDFNYMPNMVPDRKYFMSSPKGFAKNEVDGLMLRNGN